MFARDVKGVERVRREGAAYVIARTVDGKLMGYSNNPTKFNWIEGAVTGIIILTFDEYLWMTDQNRDRSFMTAAEFGEHLEWTSRGFKYYGKLVNL